MNGTRKTKNRYQMNIAVYKQRLIDAKSEKVASHIRQKIRQFRDMITRIEKKEQTLKSIAETILTYYDLDMTMRELLTMNLNGIPKMQMESLIKVRSMFFKLCSMNGIDGFIIYNYYRITECNRQVFYNRKFTDISKVKGKLKPEWEQLRYYIKVNKMTA